MNLPVNSTFPLQGIPDIDGEIGRLQNELQRVQKMRHLLGLRNTLAEERDLLAALRRQGEIAFSLPPTNLVTEPQPAPDGVRDHPMDEEPKSTDNNVG